MIAGRVELRKPEVFVTLNMPGQPGISVGFVVDTGFTEELAMPAEAVSVLGLPYLYDESAGVADGRSVQVRVHRAVIDWHGVERSVLVLAMGRRPLLGMSLLDGYELNVQCADGGLVSIEPL